MALPSGLAHTLGLVLADQAADLRRRYPDLYAEVDRILATPGRRTHPEQTDATLARWWAKPCEVCGAPIAISPETMYPERHACCSKPCYRARARLLGKRRAMAER